LVTGSAATGDGLCVVKDKTPFLVEIDGKHYRCETLKDGAGEALLVDESGAPRACRRLVQTVKNSNGAGNVYPYVRLAVGPTRQEGLHERGMCARAETPESQNWGAGVITQYTPI
jgi:hypothetical protein